MTRIPFLSLCIKAPGKERVIIYTTLVVLLCIFFLALKRKLRLIYYRIMNRKILDEQRVEKIMDGSPMRRFGEPDELVGAAILLLSRKAGSYITGSEVYVDGGFTASWF